MKISEVIKKLKEIQKKHGDLEMLSYDAEWGYGKKESIKVVKDVTVENIFRNKTVAKYDKAVV